MLERSAKRIWTRIGRTHEMKLIMLSAMYENGGNVLHRHLDGHPELLVYPFESQLGTRLVHDDLLSMFPFKYRWPVFPLDGRVEDDFERFFDEELKTRVRRPESSKFGGVNLDMAESERKAAFVRAMEGKPRTTGGLVMALFQATFEAWSNCRRSGRERYYVGYSPIVGVDADRVFADLPDARIVHVVRDPVAAYAETRHRPYPLSLDRYAWAWDLVQARSLVFREKYPGRYIVVRYEGLLAAKERTMRDLCGKLAIEYDEILLCPSWNGQALDDVCPWGAIHTLSEAEQQERKDELTEAEAAEVRLITGLTAKELGYGQ